MLSSNLVLILFWKRVWLRTDIPLALHLIGGFFRLCTETPWRRAARSHFFHIKSSRFGNLKVGVCMEGMLVRGNKVSTSPFLGDIEKQMHLSPGCHTRSLNETERTSLDLVVDWVSCKIIEVCSCSTSIPPSPGTDARMSLAKDHYPTDCLALLAPRGVENWRIGQRMTD